MPDDDRSDYVELVVLDAALDARLRRRFAQGLMAQAACPRTVAQALAAQLALEAASEPGALRFTFGGTTLHGGWTAGDEDGAAALLDALVSANATGYLDASDARPG